MAFEGNSSWVIRQPFNGKSRLPHFLGSSSPNWSLGDVQLSSARSPAAALLDKCSDGSCERGTGWLTSFPGSYRKLPGNFLLFHSQNRDGPGLAFPSLEEEYIILQQLGSVGGIDGS